MRWVSKDAASIDTVAFSRCVDAEQVEIPKLLGPSKIKNEEFILFSVFAYIISLISLSLK